MDDRKESNSDIHRTEKEEKDKAMVQLPKNKGKRKRKEVAIFGNYRSYYGYRVGQDMEEDPRLKVMKKEWFEGKDCLDIGCNAGLITVAIARKFCCRSILGVDIDCDRIEDAHFNLKKIVKKNKSMSSPRTLQAVDAKETNGGLCHLQERDLFDIVTFEQGNFVQGWHPPEGTCYDTILCLSVTKWIHLNWGDDGLITLYVKIWKLLRPGGIFILEPQPWSSYYNNRLVSETARTNYNNSKILPKDFQEILLDKIGFRAVEIITSGLSGSKSGFGRPIFAFSK